VTYQDKPIATIRAALKALLNGNLGAGVLFYDHMPPPGVREPCVVMQHIAGTTSEVAIGELVESDVKGHDVTAVFQFDVYHSTAEGRDVLTDLVLHKIWDAREWFKDGYGIEVSPARRLQDLPPGETGERLYRKSFDIPFTITMTKGAGLPLDFIFVLPEGTSDLT